MNILLISFIFFTIKFYIYLILYLEFVKGSILSKLYKNTNSPKISDDYKIEIL